MATIYTELYQRECENRFGVTRDAVREAIASPDKEQRLASQGLTLLLYSKKVDPDRYLAVITHVQGQDLMVDLAFPVRQELADEAAGGGGGAGTAALPLHLVQA
ncbi:MAG: hypothetical protein C4292_07250, partial [Nitrososphaera sp.]